MIALPTPTAIVLLIDQRVYIPPTTIAPTPTNRICSDHKAMNASAGSIPTGHPCKIPRIGTNTINPITPPRKMNEAIRIPTIYPTETKARLISNPMYSLVPRKSIAPER